MMMSKRFDRYAIVSRSLCLLALGMAWIPGSIQAQEVAATQEAQRIASSTSKAKDLSEAFRNASHVVLPSVVTILGSSKSVNETLDNLGLIDDNQRFDSVGSGVIIEDTGLIVTNHHVVHEARQLTVRLDDGREFEAQEVRSDSSSDLAILRIDCKGPLAAAKLGDSEQLAVGDWVLSIGSPFNFEQTVSAGIVSGKSRVLQGMLRGQLLQTDAAINPGNSGGALVNLEGEVVGINTAIATRNGTFSGVGFAIPMTRVKWIVSELTQRGKVRRAKVGLRVEPLPTNLAFELKLPVRSGAFVTSVTKGLPAEKAGIQTGDIIVEVAGQKIRTENDFSEIVEQLPIDQPSAVRLLREGNSVELMVSPVEREERTK